MKAVKRFFSVLFRRGFQSAYFSHHFERELTKDEVRQLNEWMAGVNRAFDCVNAELSKMPKFTEKP